MIWSAERRSPRSMPPGCARLRLSRFALHTSRAHAA
jgi:hypothetical protein